MEKKLFTVILTHFNQLEYYQTAVDSILCQNYDAIELIFADDCTQGIIKEEIENYINSNKKDNIKEYKVIINNENLGTIKSLNNALNEATGDYILCFAADDALCNEQVLNNYVKEFDENSDKVFAISFQAYLYDNKLEKYDAKFVNAKQASITNQYTAWQQFEKLTTDCYIPMGSTAFKRECFEKFGKFDECFKIVEDWSYFLKVTRSGGKFIFINHDGLKHRSGGVSHYEGNDLPPHIITYKNDTLLIFEKEVFPYIKNLPLRKQLEIYNYYNSVRENLKIQVGTIFDRVSRKEIFKQSPKLFIYRNSLLLKDFLFRNYIKFRKSFIISMLAWVFLCVLYPISKKFEIKPINYVLDNYYEIIGIVLVVFIIASGFLFVFSKFMAFIYRLYKR